MKGYIYGTGSEKQVFNIFIPDRHANNILEITPEDLEKENVKGIITDLDNTLVAWDEPNAPEEIIEWFKRMGDAGIEIVITSNNNENRVKLFSEPLDKSFIHSARKPLARAFQKARKDMGLKKEEIIVVGDQLLTDVLGGNLAGYYTVLVTPIVDSDGFWTKINRRIEKVIMKNLEHKGKI
nr:YqeG family HAD IIIA-type phosphatase [Salimicrobium jeotgali]